MTEYIVQKQHIFRDEIGRPLPKMPGDLVNVDRRRTATKLLEQGIIAKEIMPSRENKPLMRPPSWNGVRIGVFMHTSKFYSGGRIHVYQMAHTLASMGAEVFLCTDHMPIWKDDYPPLDNLLITLPGAKYSAPPEDLDIIISDGKGAPGLNAVAWKTRHKTVPFICINFETPNWMEDFDKSVAKKMPHLENVFNHADVLLCNSEESLKYLHKYMDVECATGILPPAANTYAIQAKADNPLPESMRGTPYIVWSARASRYKGAHVIVKAVQDYKKPLNLVMVGKPSAVPQNTPLHKFISFKTPINDAQKMRLMKDAACTATPSTFEGFGMVPSESLISGTPVVAYDLPVLRQNYGDRLVYAKWNNVADFTKKLYETIEKRPKVDVVDAANTFGMPKMKSDMAKLPYINLGRKSVSAHMICYYGPTVQEAIASVYDHVDEVIIAHGPTKLWTNYPADNSLELIRAFPDPENKIKLEARSVWENKGEMRKWTTSKMTGNYMLIVDADEIYHNLDRWIEKAPDWGCPRWVHLWHNVEHFVTDTPGMARWGQPHELGGCIHNHFRWAYWRYSNQWKNVRGTIPIGADAGKISMGHQTEAAVKACPEACIYHLGHVMTRELMKEKHEFYLKRDGADAGRKKRMSAWHNWNGKAGDCGDGLIKKVDWDLPELVHQAYAKIIEGA